MNEFFDINHWINGYSFVKNGSKEIKILSDSLKKNNISSIILTNKLALSYDWNLGNNELLKSEVLLKEDDIYFSFILAPEVYYAFNFKKYIKNCLKNKVVLFRLFPKSYRFKIDDYYMEKIYKVLSYHRIPVMLDLKQLDITGNKYFELDGLKKVLSNNKDLPLILECSLKQLMFSRFFYPLLEEYKNLHIEASGLYLIDQIEDIVEKFGSSRLIFGTSYPDLNMSFSTGRIIMSGMDDNKKKDIAFNNISRIIRSIKVD